MNEMIAVEEDDNALMSPLLLLVVKEDEEEVKMPASVLALEAGGEGEEGEEEKKELEGESDWHASIRGPSLSFSAAEHQKKKRGNRGSLDGTRRFRKVVTFRNSLVQTKLIGRRGAARQRGRNSLLPWFSSNAQQHTQETLEEIQQRKEIEKQEKEKKKQLKIQLKQQKENKKKLKKQKKKLEKETKKAQKLQKKKKKEKENQDHPDSHSSLQLNHIVNTQNQDQDNPSLIFEDSLTNHNLDVSLNVEDLMANSSRNNQHNNHASTSISTGINNASAGITTAAMHDSILVDHSRRRRSSVTTAILNTMGKLKINNSRNKHKSSKQPNQSKTLQTPDQPHAHASYDWSAHRQNAASNPHSQSHVSFNTSHQQELDMDMDTDMDMEQPNQNQMHMHMRILQEEDTFQQEMTALPKQSKKKSCSNNNSSGNNCNLNSSMDISGESFAGNYSSSNNNNNSNSSIHNNETTTTPRRGRKPSKVTKSVTKNAFQQLFGTNAQKANRKKAKLPSNAPRSKQSTKRNKNSSKDDSNNKGSNNGSATEPAFQTPLCQIVSMEASS
ncbi:expressed unknown protein [Seminavis robusta]|uniref:Uncharacterized protein n=1 Tax=Seminavis robusta TaxID=568900 RepID=A0A9N8HC31_9STRA|nr:expressed unknown protein [Seminavis robusta]|eukprot:Sro362_g126770.1 n/a (556) ;mRNA; r:41715-43382